MTTIHLTEEMFAAGQPVAQGEVLIWMKKYAPKSVLKQLADLKLSEMKLEKDQLILGHSETDHHHVLEAVRPKTHISKAATALIDAVNDNLMELHLHEECQVIHMRGFDTHKALVLPAGYYIRGIREEQSPEGWRRVAD
jgi:hypothetical protein